MNQNENNLRPYFTYGLPLLGLMGVIATLGVALTVIVGLIF